MRRKDILIFCNDQCSLFFWVKTHPKRPIIGLSYIKLAGVKVKVCVVKDKNRKMSTINKALTTKKLSENYLYQKKPGLKYRLKFLIVS